MSILLELAGAFALLFVPGTRPADLYQPERKSPVRLYVRRVFVTDEAKALIPSYLRFLRGVVDTEDIALNVSREMLQHDPVLARIGSGLPVGRVGTPDDLAQGYLLAMTNGFMTGAIIDIDGGGLL